MCVLQDSAVFLFDKKIADKLHKPCLSVCLSVWLAGWLAVGVCLVAGCLSGWLVDWLAVKKSG